MPATTLALHQTQYRHWRGPLVTWIIGEERTVVIVGEPDDPFAVIREERTGRLKSRLRVTDDIHEWFAGWLDDAVREYLNPYRLMCDA